MKILTNQERARSLFPPNTTGTKDRIQMKMLGSIFSRLSIVDLPSLVFSNAKMNKIQNNFDQKTKMSYVG